MPFALLLGELVTIWACLFIRSTCTFRIPQRKVTANKGVKKHHLRELLHLLWLFCQLLSVNNVCSSAGAVRTDDKGHRALWKNDSLQTLIWNLISTSEQAAMTIRCRRGDRHKCLWDSNSSHHLYFLLKATIGWKVFSNHNWTVSHYECNCFNQICMRTWRKRLEVCKCRAYVVQRHLPTTQSCLVNCLTVFLFLSLPTLPTNSLKLSPCTHTKVSKIMWAPITLAFLRFLGIFLRY